MTVDGTDRQAPRLAGRLANRDDLFARLDSLTPLTIVRGLPGTGKTTLVASWLSERGYGKGTWVKMEPGSDLDEQAQSLTSGFLIIDNAHFFRDPAAIDNLCKRLKDHLDLFIVMCSMYPHPIEEKALQENLPTTVIASSELMVPQDSMHNFLTSWGYDLTKAQIDMLLQTVGGWLGPARIALQGSSASRFALNIEDARRFCMDRVLTPLSRSKAVPLQDLATLSLARLTNESLIQALGIDADLHALARFGILETQTDKNTSPTWVFPPLIRDTLLQTFKDDDAKEIKHTHARLAQYFASDLDHLEHAMRHARTGEAWSTLKVLWHKFGIDLAGSYPNQFIAAYKDFPEEVLQEYPDLVSAESIAAGLLGDPNRPSSKAVLNHFLLRANGAADLGQGTPVSNERVLNTAGELIAYRLRRQPQRGAKIAADLQHDLDNAPEEDRREISPRSLAWFDFEWGTTELTLNNGPTAAAALNRACLTAQDIGDSIIASRASGTLAIIHAIDGTTKDSRLWLEIFESQWQKTIPFANDYALPANLAATILAMDKGDGKLAQEQLSQTEPLTGNSDLLVQQVVTITWFALHYGDTLAVLQLIQELSRAFAERSNDDAKYSSVRLVIERCHLDLLLAQGQLTQVHSRLIGSENEFFFQVPRARLALIAGSPQEAYSVAIRFPTDSRTILRDALDISIIAAAAALEIGEPTDAASAFRRACQLSKQVDTVLPFRTISKTLLDELFAVSGIETAESDRIKSSLGKPIYPQSGELVMLSAREQIVLEKLSTFESAVDIAEELVVSANTVKKQLASIYTKLNVHDRSSALLKASQLGLLR